MLTNSGHAILHEEHYVMLGEAEEVILLKELGYFIHIVFIAHHVQGDGTADCLQSLPIRQGFSDLDLREELLLWLAKDIDAAAHAGDRQPSSVDPWYYSHDVQCE